MPTIGMEMTSRQPGAAKEITTTALPERRPHAGRALLRPVRDRAVGVTDRERLLATDPLAPRDESPQVDPYRVGGSGRLCVV
jgi:hypothetical protein